MKEEIELVVGEPKRKGGFSLPIVVSAVVHALLVYWFVTTYKPMPPRAENVPMARYVELMQQNPKEFVEAPGPKIDQAPLNAPLSDANRKASMPEPTGDQPTKRPGDGSGLYTPPMGDPRPRGPQPSAPSPAFEQAPQQPSTAPATQQPSNPATQQPPPDDRLVYRESQNQRPASANAGTVDWKNAIKEVGKIASLGGGNDLDLGKFGGGEKGKAEQGPLSFETQWYDWGDYAQSMVSRIRVNWYANMPQLIRTGMPGKVTIRFTIHRDGRISDVTILEGSGIPPYDHAAKKAIELSSPLNALPKDFPNPYERVTAMFFYNMEIPNR